MIRMIAVLVGVMLAGNWLNAADRPNVLIVMTDDQGLGDFSYMGNPVLKTPQLDEFARQSVRLTDFHVCPMCSPTRGQLLTGLSALRNGATSVTAGRTFLRPGLPTLPDTFAKSGYQTGIFGKWHLGDFYPHRPMDRGFQESVYHLGWGQLHSTPEFDWPLIDGRYFHNGAEKRYQGHCTDFWFDSAMAWMKDKHAKDEPFLCYIPTNAPHAPHIDLEDDIAPYKGKGPAAFFGMIAHIDRRFGDLMKFLNNEKLADNTIVIFMTDNGGTAGVQTFNAGLRAGKTTNYEGGHRVPCWIRWPAGKIGQPRDVEIPTSNTDLFPTLCDWCQVPIPQWEERDRPYLGSNLAGLLQGETLPSRTLVVQYGQIPEKYKSCVIRDHWRLVNGAELYDLRTDRGQKSDISTGHPQIVEELKSYYDSWWSGLESQLHDFVPISIGSTQQPLVELNSGDWEGIYADNSGFVREAVGGPTGGHWHIQVEQPGDYEFTLRRWPEQTGAALGAAYPPSEKSPSNKPKVQTKAFPKIAKSHLKLGDEEQTVAADPQTTSSVIVRRNVKPGRTILKAWFTDSADQGLCGAFYVTVRRIDRQP